MYAKKLKRKCMVRGCRCIDTYSISLTREHGGSVIICHSCLTSGIKAATIADKEPIKKVIIGKPPDLFFSDINKPVVDEKFICQQCGKECASGIGLISHERSCKGGEKDED